MAFFTVIVAQEWIASRTLAVSIEANGQADAEIEALLVAENTCATEWNEGVIEQHEAYAEEIRPMEISEAASPFKFAPRISAAGWVYPSGCSNCRWAADRAATSRSVK